MAYEENTQSSLLSSQGAYCFQALKKGLSGEGRLSKFLKYDKFSVAKTDVYINCMALLNAH